MRCSRTRPIGPVLAGLAGAAFVAGCADVSPADLTSADLVETVTELPEPEPEVAEGELATEWDDVAELQNPAARSEVEAPTGSADSVRVVVELWESDRVEPPGPYDVSRVPGDVGWVYGRLDPASGLLLDSVSVMSRVIPHSADEAASEFDDWEYDGEIMIEGRLAVWEPWYGPEDDQSLGTSLVWDASPERYVWIESRSRSLDELVAIAGALDVSEDDVRWDARPSDLSALADEWVVERDHGAERLDGFSAWYGWESFDLSGERTGFGEIDVYLHVSDPDEIVWHRHRAFAESVMEIDGRVAYLLTIDPAAARWQGQYRLVWMRDDNTIGVAQGAATPEALLAAARHFDPALVDDEADPAERPPATVVPAEGTTSEPPVTTTTSP